MKARLILFSLCMIMAVLSCVYADSANDLQESKKSDETLTVINQTIQQNPNEPQDGVKSSNPGNEDKKTTLSIALENALKNPEISKAYQEDRSLTEAQIADMVLGLYENTPGLLDRLEGNVSTYRDYFNLRATLANTLLGQSNDAMLDALKILSQQIDVDFNLPSSSHNLTQSREFAVTVLNYMDEHPDLREKLALGFTYLKVRDVEALVRDRYAYFYKNDDPEFYLNNSLFLIRMDKFMDRLVGGIIESGTTDPYEIAQKFVNDPAAKARASQYSPKSTLLATFMDLSSRSKQQPISKKPSPTPTLPIKGS